MALNENPIDMLNSDLDYIEIAVDDTEDTEAFTQTKSPSSIRYTANTHDIIQAYVALLDKEVVTAQNDTETFRLIRMHYAKLEQWHETHTGWRLQRGSTFFRLERHLHALTPVFTDDRLKKPRDFACLAWLLWFAEKRYIAGGGRTQQFLLSQMAEDLQEQTKIVGGPGKQLDFRNQQDRYSMGHALEYLTQLGAIQSIEGEARKWIDDADQPDNEVLYEFTSIAHSLAEALHENQVAAIAVRLTNALRQLQPAYLAAETEHIPPLNRAWRTLLLGPALLRFDDPQAFAALAKQASTVSDELAETFGWQLELNNDYACIVRGNSLSSGSGPGLSLNGATDQMILLLCSSLRQRVEAGRWLPDSYGCVHLTSGDLAELFTDLRQHYGMHWGARTQTVKATELLDEIYQKMRLLSLMRGPDAAGDILLLPTVSRYAVSYSEEQPDVQNQPRARSTRAITRAVKAPQMPLIYTDKSSV